MIIPHLHFYGNCEEVFPLYEKAFNTKVENIVRNSEYSSELYAGDSRIAHATMKISGQTVFLNDNEEMFNDTDKTLDFPIHIIVYFKTSRELLDCYEILKQENEFLLPFVKTPYSELTGNFKDKFGIMWGFMVE